MNTATNNRTHDWAAKSLALLIAVGAALPALARTHQAEQSDPTGKTLRLPDPEPQGVVGISNWSYAGEADGAPFVPGAIPGTDIPLGGTREPTVAVNPNDPDNIAYASLFQLRVSTDGGATFQPAVMPVVDAGQGWCGDPSVAFDSQGSLFWTYLGCLPDPNDPNDLMGIDIYIAQADPTTGAFLAGYPVNVTASPGVDLPASDGNFHDKEWLAADRNPSSPFADQLYIVWTQFTPEGTIILVSSSSDQGQTWSAPLQLSDPHEGFVWPSHNTVAPNGDAFVAYHSQPGFNASGTPDGVSGQVFVLRSTDGGASFPQKTLAYAPGEADMTFNVQTTDGAIPGAIFWLQGSVQPWVVADPFTPGRIYVVANDDPDNDPTAGDYADVFITISSDSGQTWSAPTRIDSGPGTTFQVMATAGTDEDSGCISVHYYDNRAGSTNADGNFLLDVFTTVSADGGVTFAPDVQINDLPFDPDPGAPCRFDCNTQTPTMRIGEYNGVAGALCQVDAVWTGNRFDGGGDPIRHQIYFDTYNHACDTELPTITCTIDNAADPILVDPNCAATIEFSAVITDNCCVDADNLNLVVSATDTSGFAVFVEDPPSITSIQQDSDTQVTVQGTVLVRGLTGCPVTVRITVDADDCSANPATQCVTVANVEDKTAPELTCPPDAFFEHGNFLCNEGEVLDWLNSAVATDNCDPNAVIEHDAPDCGFPPDSTTVVTWTATDACDNSSQCSATVTIPPADRGQPGLKGSVLVYPNIELRWNAVGTLIQDTFVTLENDFNDDVDVQMYFANESCTRVDNGIVLTHDEPAYWSADTGMPKGVSPFTVLGDPYPDPEGSGDFILRGFVVAFAVDNDGHEIRWNHLTGGATVVNYATQSAWEYNAWAFRSDCGAHAEEPLDCIEFDPNGVCCDAIVIPGNLDFDGFQYDMAPNRLLLNFIASGSAAFSSDLYTVMHDSDLTLHIMDHDFRQENNGPVTTKVQIIVWNENEVGFSGLTRCITCWDQTLLSSYGEHFLRHNLQTDMGRARIDGVASTVCPGSVDAALIGLANRILEVDGTETGLGGSSLWISGREAANIQYDLPSEPEEKNEEEELAETEEAPQSRPTPSQ